MKRLVLIVLALVLTAGPALAAKIYIDHDTNYDWDAVETFGWAKTEDTSVAKANPLLHSRIVNAIEHYITMDGTREVESDPDVWVTYHASSKEEVSVNTSHYGYGYPSGWAWGGYYGYGMGASMGSSMTTVSTYETGTLVLDVWDAKAKELIWRGTAANIMVSKNPDKMEARIDAALKKMVSKSRKLQQKADKNK